MNICPIRYTPYLNNSKRRQRMVDPNRAKSSQGMRLNSSSQNRCSTQQSPNRTPSQGELQQLEIQHQAGPIAQNQQQLFLSTQIRRSPSFRLKNYHAAEITSSTQSNSHQKRQNFIVSGNQSKEERINRINFLGDLLQQMEQNGQQTKQSLSTEMTTVPKPKFEILNARTLTEYEQNIEELHFYLVDSQQRTKQYAQVIEKQKQINEYN
ncbi:unnamed protein product (macronuclear) [Paramecium tetraurelia]|uniref:Uncharacterized protein n=1 Tax=Paramecium tetraurelia TaxID=5888 RepID=A0BZZ5_PARTE|nr:uncharacterized protein GSPATT00005964001 [Paramecium tetraurelia]CAK64112.1 unnamed protein product [Paramecium tetraurelia]|eukprot:XP_001431510.1 hypothetical protein (macronuclear) [Paramecium tetraurelia strain d4-2]